MPVPRTHQQLGNCLHELNNSVSGFKVYDEYLSLREEEIDMKENARTRRHLRRALVVIKRRQTLAANSLQSKQCSHAANAQITKDSPSKHGDISRVDKAISIQSSKVFDSFNNCCLPQVALYCVGHRNSQKKIT